MRKTRSIETFSKSVGDCEICARWRLSKILSSHTKKLDKEEADKVAAKAVLDLYQTNAHVSVSHLQACLKYGKERTIDEARERRRLLISGKSFEEQPGHSGDGR